MLLQHEAMIAVGAGTINDVVKFVSSKAKIPYGIVATAPSMDGYASSVSPLIVNGFKRTYDATYPIFIVGDTKVLKDAPYDMITSGFGDIIGKFTSLADWYIGSLITGEDYSEEIAKDVKNSLSECINVSKSLKSKDDIIEMMKERKNESKEEFEFRINKNFGNLSSEVFKDIGYYYLDEDKRKMRQERILRNWDTMKKWVTENVPTVEYVDELLNDAGAPSDVAYLDLKYDELRDVLLNAKEVRKRYTILRLAEDINIDKIFDMAIKN